MGHHGTKRAVLVYLPEQLHRWLKVRAAMEGRSLSALIEEASRIAYPEQPARLPEAARAAESPPEPYRGRARNERRSRREESA